MSRRKTVLGMAVVFALALSAFAAANASAGLTGFTCVKDAPNGKFSGAHCLAGPGEYKHVAIAANTTTTITATNQNTAAGTTAARSQILKSALAGVATEITCKEVHGEGTFENKTSAKPEMYVHFEGQLHYTGCEVKAPAGKKCEVKEGKITTEKITGTSEGVAQPEVGKPHKIKITPAAATPFTNITIEKCEIAALNNTYPLTGSFIAETEGATLTTSHSNMTAQNTLKFGGVKAGLDGALTIKGHSKAGEETNPITVTTEAP